MDLKINSPVPFNLFSIFKVFEMLKKIVRSIARVFKKAFLTLAIT